MNNKTVVFDFDGVIHSYTSGWQGVDVIPDEPVKGIENALKEIDEAGYEIVIVSTRCSAVVGAKAVAEWLNKYGLAQYIDKICKEKPPAIVYIDDRAICFDGRPEKLLSKIESFVPWNKKGSRISDCKVFNCIDEAINEHGDVKRVTIANKAFTIIGGRCGVLLPQTELYSYIPTINLPKDIVSEILIRNDEYKVVDISAKFKDEKGFKFRKLVLSDGKNVYVNNKYYKKFKQFKLYDSDKKTPVIKAYDDNDNLVGFFMPFHPDYFERRYGETD